MRISKYGDTIWANNIKKVVPNDRQLNSLKDLAISINKVNSIAFDNGEKESILWTKDTKDNEFNEGIFLKFKQWLLKK